MAREIQFLESTSNPTTSDDHTLAIREGTVWRNTSDNELFVCVDSTPGAAVWVTLGSNLTEAEVALLDGVTAGTVTASKALSVDASRNVATIGNLTIDGNFVTGSTTLTEAELGVLDGVTVGTPAASKALTLDANSEMNSIGVVKSQDTLISSAQVLALNATPITCVTAPGAGVFAEFLGAYLFLDYNATAYGGIAAGEDLVFKYTDASGAAVSQQVETTGFLDATADQLAIAYPDAADTSGLIAAVANAAIVLHLLVGEITTGDSPLKVRTYYREIRTAALEAIA